MRVHQYIKNLFVFAPMLFSFHYTSESIVSTIIAFILFSLLASSVYIFNDIMDIEEDKNHPTKRFRPLASGMIDKKYAIIMICILAIPSLVLGFFVNTQLAGILSSYFLLNFIYSIKLKHIAIVDIFIIASGFVLRLFAGAVVIEVHLSIWLIIMTFLLALFLALAKRRDDVLLASEGKATRKNIDGYNLEFVNSAMGLMSAVIIVSYILYTISEEVIDRLGTPYLYLTTLFVILGIMRFMQITFVENASGSPANILLKDRFMQISILLWLALFFGLSLL